MLKVKIMQKGFNNLPRLVQVILLLIPGVNWVVEILVRWSAFFNHARLGRFIVAILVTLFGLIFGWIDVIWCLLFKHLIFASTI